MTPAGLYSILSAMPTIVLHKPTRQRYILLGSGRQAPGVTLSSDGKFAQRDEAALLAVCDAEGEIKWLEARSLQVIDVDGSAPVELLAERRRGEGTTELVEGLLDSQDEG